jgi:hypothetical protein
MNEKLKTLELVLLYYLLSLGIHNKYYPVIFYVQKMTQTEFIFLNYFVKLVEV